MTDRPRGPATRMTGIWEIRRGPPLNDPDRSTGMLAVLRRITEAIPPDAECYGMEIQLGQYHWTFRPLSPLTLLEGPDGGYAVLAERTSHE